MKHTENIILIGMPGAGKSTVGVVLAKRLGLRFLDADLVIQERSGQLLHELIAAHGVEGFLQLENDVLCTLELNGCVLATGGSAAYASEAMAHLRTLGRIVYLKLSCAEVAERLGDLTARGVAMRPGQTLPELYRERVPLYERYAQLTVDCDGKSLRQIVLEIASAVTR
ncbi:MAG: shikimate kinase [Oscillospiraceae bacterium]|nr:shikimate kinase [Oscillospiraceae bacterium]